MLRRIVSFESVRPHALVETLSDILGRGAPDLTVTPRREGDLAALVYTSGTTGVPKGVMQTHANHLANVRQSFEAGIYREESKIFLTLPLAHSFAKLMGYIGFLRGVELKFPRISSTSTSKADPVAITADLSASKALLVPLVPRLFEKMREGIERRARSSALIAWALAAAKRRYDGVPTGADRMFAPVMDLLCRKIRHKLFGSSFEYAISGGAKLDPEVNRFFDAIGIEILEGYGLTETCVATNVNRLGKKKIGSVGPVLARDIEMKIEPDGEILFRGPNVALGYYERPAATAEAWTPDGWFRTGDLGSIDEDGYLFITGRKKEIIVLSGGKKIAPDPVEQRLKGHALVSQVVLYGDGRPYCIAVITIARDAASALLSSRRIPVDSAEARASLTEALQKHIDAVNTKLAGYERVGGFTFSMDEWTVENAILTPTLKVKRRLVHARYAAEIERCYESR